ncbi:heterokaryon incompatibility protein-domain-containing protein [Hypoxylon rubiginosum]|uniref:Heterokaryon incompatibility protein-domain-containing protein n=1 Tax=Hypoxylon rubiginosum TaxID=110542 RepID=A0ACB9YQK8_9PEZI|nr:heterokaryon incompatibility protein-domain-containing protein [Hypoxylon rubiginosum]
MGSFEYQGIIRDDYAFRLIKLYPGTNQKIEVEIIHAFLDKGDPRPYEAVSYVWGSQWKASLIHVNNGSSAEKTKPTLEITNNLDLILRDLRYEERDRYRYLWIDAICIDQSNIKERNHQVRRMGKNLPTRRARPVTRALDRPVTHSE